MTKKSDGYAGTWPVSARIASMSGGVRMEIDGKPVMPMIYYGGTGLDYPEFEPFYETIPMARDAGTPVLFWVNEYDDFAHNDRVNRRVFDMYPDCYGILRMGYYPKLDDSEMSMSANGETNYVASYSSDVYRGIMKVKIENFVDWLRAQPYANRIIGVQVMFGTTGEWYYDVNHYEVGDYCAASRNGFKAWLKQKYGTPAALSAAWGRKVADFTQADIPEPAERYKGEDGYFRLSKTQQASIDYESYYSDSLCDLIRYLCDLYKNKTGPDFLLGVLYGYVNMFSGWRVPQATGHFGLSKILDYRGVDFLSCPLFYHRRRAGASSESMGYYHTAALNNKMYILENDTRHYMCAAPDWPHKDDYRKHGVYGTDTLQDSLSVSIRDGVTQVILSGGMYWMDLVSRGWLKDEKIWDTNHAVLNIAASKMLGSRSLKLNPQVVLVEDDRTTDHMSLSSGKIIAPMYSNQVTELAYTGFAYGTYHTEDLDKLPASVKTIVLINPGCLTAKIRADIEKLKCGGRVIIFMYTADYVDHGRNDDALMGIKTQKLPGPVLCDSYLCGSLKGFDTEPEKVYFPEGIEMNPAFYVDDEDAVTVACYKNAEGKASVAYKKHKNWTAVYCGVPMLSGMLLKALTRMSGAHEYSNLASGTLKTDGSLFLHIAQHSVDGQINTIRFPQKCRVTDMISQQLISDAADSVTFESYSAQSRVFNAFPGKTKEVPVKAGNGGAGMYEFKGSFVSVSARISPEGGRIGVRVDGLEYPYLETFGTAERDGEFVVSHNLEQGAHKLELYAFGTRHRDSKGDKIQISKITSGTY